MSENTTPIPRASQMKDWRRRNGRFLRPALLLALLLAWFCGPRYAAQQRGGAGNNGVGNLGPSAPPSMDSMDQDPMYPGQLTPANGESPIMHARRMKALNAERQKSMVQDSVKLLRLTAELNEEVNGAHPQPFNTDQLRKVAEIEKLAKSVRDKMSTPVGGASPMLMQPHQYPFPGIQ